MFQRFHALRERDERGFTLIELLVVILIIAILAAIAIPVFLNQRKKGWVSKQQSALKNAATAMETYATETGGDYSPKAPPLAAADIPSLEAALASNYGFNPTANVTLDIVSADGTGFCLSAVHDPVTVTWYYDSDGGEPTVTACT
ncbi:MAG: prepilin-type N-terminal cleavage/methylation domain-containing protein [Actinomycetota bacterium]